MPKSLALSSITALVVLTSGCSDPGPTNATKGPVVNGVGTVPDGRALPDGGVSNVPTSSGPLGVLVIDTQQVFFSTAQSRNPGSNLGARMAHSARVMQLAAAKRVPTFVTYERSKSGNYAMPPALAGVIPPQAQEFVKTTFAATGQPQFIPAIQASGVKRLITIGAETDVCVMQTMLGLRRAGYEVIAVVDALVTEEVNPAPALRRMAQAGIVQVGMQEAEAMLQSGAATPAPSTTTLPPIVSPLNMGFLLHGIEGLGAADPNSAPKMVRLRELLLVSEWFKIPLFAANPQAALAALPQQLRSVITRPIQPLAARPAQITQLAVAGGHVGIAQAVAGLAGVDVFLVEDALIGSNTAALEPLHQAGAVPTTYKTLWYELTLSIEDSQWPSRQWVVDGDRYFDLTKAPEELPQLSP